MTCLVPLALPKLLNIPYFAMGSPRAREERLTACGLDEAARRLLGQHATAWLSDHIAEGGGVRIVRTRSVKQPKTAVYTDWLEFPDAKDAARFLEAFPRFDIARTRHDNAHRRDGLETELDARLARGDFDLGRYGKDHRDGLAGVYQRKVREMREATEAIKGCDLAEQEALRWSALRQ